MSQVITAKDFMRRELTTLGPDNGLSQGVAKLLDNRITGAPVVDASGRFLGVFAEKSCIQGLAEVIESFPDHAQSLTSVAEFMNRKVHTLAPDTDVFEAIDELLAKRISGAPVVDENQNYLGIFSEKTAMQVIVGALFEHLPGSTIRRYMNLDRNRLLDPRATILDAAQVFIKTPYRRLPVLEGERLLGQVSRRDVIAAAQQWIVAQRKTSLEQRCIGDYVDRHALTKTPSSDLLEIAEAFLNSPYRRLPILENGRLVGQVSRRDLLEVAAKMLRPQQPKEQVKPLYLSAVNESLPPSLE
ncbi:MAG: CBS domain-containing protein [Pirellulaceae bacterium]|jgi:CBS domain-containing protein|nr:CBS domain-containing protein [Pirellulaceae bacterium]